MGSPRAACSSRCAVLSSKLVKNGRFAVSFLGDGASNQGTFHESLKLVAGLSVPLLFVCKNNQYAVGMRTTESSKIADISKRAAGNCIPGVIADGMNVVRVYKAASRERPLWLRVRPDKRGSPANSGRIG